MNPIYIVYVDVMYLWSLVLNLALMAFAQFIFKREVKIIRLILIGITISFLDVIIFIWTTNNIIIYQILYSAIHASVIKLLYKIDDFRSILALFCTALLVCGTYSLLINRAVSNNLFISAICFVITCVILLIFCSYHINKTELSINIYNISIGINQKTIRLKGYYDSGNMLIDSYTGNPVIILQCNELVRLIGTEIETTILQYQRSGQFDYQRAYRTTNINFYPINYRTINNSINIMPAFKLSNICFLDSGTLYENITAGLSRYELTTDNSYTVLLNQKLKPIREENSND